MRSHVPDALHINDTEDPSIMTPSLPSPQKANPSAKTLFESKRSQDFVTAMDRRRLDIAKNFADGKAAMVRIPRGEVPQNEVVKNTVLVAGFGDNDPEHGKATLHMCINGRPGPGLAKDISASSPTCHSQHVMMSLALRPLLGWKQVQLDVIAAYPLTKPMKIYYAKYPHGFREYLVAKANGGAPEF